MNRHSPLELHGVIQWGIAVSDRLKVYFCVNVFASQMRDQLTQIYCIFFILVIPCFITGNGACLLKSFFEKSHFYCVCQISSLKFMYT